MQSIVTNTTIAARIKAIGLKTKVFARRAGIAPSTLWRLTRNGDALPGQLRTYRKILAALEAEERRVAEHLAQLAPDQAARPVAALAPAAETPSPLAPSRLAITAITEASAEEGDAA